MAQPPKPGAAKTKGTPIITAACNLVCTTGLAATARYRDGRPSEFHPEILAEFLERLASGESVRAICQDAHMPTKTSIYRWILAGKKHDADPAFKAFSDQYEVALRIKAMDIADELFEITDDGRNDWMEKYNKDGELVGWSLNGEAVQRSRLRADKRQWFLSKVLPKLYGEKIIVSGDEEAPVQHQHEHEHTHTHVLGGWDEIDKRMEQFIIKE